MIEPTDEMIRAVQRAAARHCDAAACDECAAKIATAVLAAARRDNRRRRTTEARPLYRDCVMRSYDQIVATLVAAREAQGIDVATLAGHTDCTRSALSTHLRGLHRMDALTLLQAANGLGLDLLLVQRHPS